MARKAKSAAKKESAASNNSSYIHLKMSDIETIEELSPRLQKKAFQMHINTIRQLMTCHNALVDSKATLTQSNANAVTLAAAVLESVCAQKIARMNAWLSEELDHVRSVKKASKKKSKVARKKNKKKVSTRNAR